MKLIALCLVLAACTPAQTVAGVTLAVCILNTYSADIASGMSDAAAVVDTVTRCGTDAVSVATTLDASRAAEQRMAAAKPAAGK